MSNKEQVMKEESKKIINGLNENRIKVFYQLNQLMPITGMSIRSLKYRMKKVKEKYSDMPNLLKRNGRTWQIHYTIIDEFMPVYKKAITTINNHKWETLVTWNTKDSYDVKYHIQLVNELKREIPYANIAYVIEQDGRGNNHIHAITDGYLIPVTNATNKVLSKYLLNEYNCKYQIENINKRYSITSYLQKGGKITIL
jgi:hypothetical protein